MRVRPPAVDRAERDALVLAHVDLVKAMASRLGRRLPAQVEVPDLVSVGVLGLIDAATRYQPSLGVPFEAFARRRINGAMLDALRGLDWVPRSVRRLQRDVDRAIGDLRHALGREPEAPEIAEALGVTEDVYGEMLDELRSADLAVMRQSGGERDGFNEIEVAIDGGDGPHSLLERNELRRRLAEALAKLPPRERHILALYYDQELTLAEIGEVIGVGESRVSQLRSQAIARLRSLMRESIDGYQGRQAS
ncbi:MAG: RNA polymerase sigma factor FliA [Vicinamibacterales bacterium]